MRFRTGPGVARRVLAIAAVVAVAATGGCGKSGGSSSTDASASPENVTLQFNFWGAQDRADVTAKAVTAFQTKYPNITVKTSFAEFGAYFTKLATEVGGGAGPDVMQMDFRYLREYADRGVLAELNANGIKVGIGDISTSLLASGKVRGKLYAVPVGQNTQEFSYDPKVYAAAGATIPDNWKWDDLKSAAQKVSDASNGASVGFTDPGGIDDWFEVWLRQKGKLLYTDDGKLGYTASDIVDWWTFTDGLRKSKAVTPAEVTSKLDGSQANDPVVKKTSNGGFGYDSGFTAKSWEILGRELTITSFPSNDPNILGQYAKPSMQYAVSKNSAHPKEAAKLIDFLINDPDVAPILGMSRGLPSNKKNQATVGATLTGPPAVSYAFEQKIAPRLKEAPPPPPKGAGDVKKALQRIYDDVTFGRKTPQAAADAFITEAKQAIGQ